MTWLALDASALIYLIEGTTGLSVVGIHSMSTTKIAIIGGTGYSGRNIAQEAVRRGLTVTAVARSAPKDAISGVTYVQGGISDDALLDKLAAEHDVVVVAIHAVDDQQQPVLPLRLPALARAAIAGKARLGFVGGAGSSLVAPGGARHVDSPDFPAVAKTEALVHASALEWLRNESPAELDWFYISPAAGYVSFNPGEPLGRYRRGGDLLVVDDQGKSFISGADYALAFVDEIVTPTLHRARTTTGY